MKRITLIVILLCGVIKANATEWKDTEYSFSNSEYFVSVLLGSEVPQYFRDEFTLAAKVNAYVRDKV
mgnify:CR=1 FL=1